MKSNLCVRLELLSLQLVRIQLLIGFGDVLDEDERCLRLIDDILVVSRGQQAHVRVRERVVSAILAAPICDCYVSGSDYRAGVRIILR
jgi:hypothetical protein